MHQKHPQKQKKNYVNENRKWGVVDPGLAAARREPSTHTKNSGDEN